MSQRRRFKILLTEKQINAIGTALMEWAEVEASSLTGAPIRRYLLKVLDSIARQHRKAARR